MLMKSLKSLIFNFFVLVVIAELVPKLNLFISLIGALCATGNKFYLKFRSLPFTLKF